MDMLEDGKQKLPATQPRKHSDVLLHVDKCMDTLATKRSLNDIDGQRTSTLCP
jgi:hypothetical protein